MPELAPNDPLLAYFVSAPGAVDLDALNLDSPALRALRAAGVKLAVPLVSQGELIGLLQPGAAPEPAGVLGRRPRAAQQPGDPGRPGGAGRPAGAAAEAEARERERIEQELRVAR